MDTIDRSIRQSSAAQDEMLEASAAVRLRVKASRVTFDLAIRADVLIPVALFLAIRSLS